MSHLKIIHEKLNQAVEILEEKKVDLWITFVRETTQVSDPCLDLLLGFDLTWQSALMISRTGERVAIVGRFDADNVERVGGYTSVVGYDQSVREPLLAHLARLNPRQVALMGSRMACFACWRRWLPIRNMPAASCRPRR